MKQTYSVNKVFKKKQIAPSDVSQGEQGDYWKKVHHERSCDLEVIAAVSLKCLHIEDLVK